MLLKSDKNYTDKNKDTFTYAALCLFPPEAQQERYHRIIEKTKEFEALRKECIRVLPYADKSGQV